MICAKCGCHDRVIRTLRREGSVFRVRRCIACGHAIETEEKPTENPPLRKKKRAESPKKDDPADKPKGALAQALLEAI